MAKETAAATPDEGTRDRYGVYAVAYRRLVLRTGKRESQSFHRGELLRLRRSDPRTRWLLSSGAIVPKAKGVPERPLTLRQVMRKWGAPDDPVAEPLRNSEPLPVTGGVTATAKEDGSIDLARA